MNDSAIARSYDRESDALNDLLWERDYRIERWTEQRAGELYIAIRETLAACGFGDEWIHEIAMQQAEREAEQGMWSNKISLWDEV